MDEKQLFSFLTEKRSYKWDSVLEKRIEREEIDPWALDLKVLIQLCLDRLEERNIGLDVSGKVLLVSSILLRIKAQLLGLELFKEEEQEEKEQVDIKESTKEEIKMKLPTPRKRKATLKDLVDSLEKAIRVEDRRERRKKEEERSGEEVRKELEKTKPEERGINLKAKIKEVFEKIKKKVRKLGKKTVAFSKLVRGGKEEKVWTFVSLVYLANQGKIYLEQGRPFGELEVSYEP